jgi:hypothetical protein
MKAEAESTVMLPQAKEWQDAPETGRGKEEVSPGAFGVSTALRK